MVYLRADAEAGTRKNGRRAPQRARRGEQGALRQGRYQAGPQERGPGRLRSAHDPSEELRGAKVEEMLLAMKGMGRIKVTRVLREAGISRSKTLVGLTHGQREIG